MREIGNEKKGKMQYKRVTAWFIALVMVCTGLNVPAAVMTAEAATTNYISEVAINVNQDSYWAKQHLTDKGFTVIDQDLDAGCYDSDSVYMGYKTTTKEEEAITSFCIDPSMESITAQGYELVMDRYGVEVQNLNGGSDDWTPLYMGYSKDPDKGLPITEIFFQDFKVSSAVSGISLNEGTYKYIIYDPEDIYMYTRTDIKSSLALEDSIVLGARYGATLIEGTDYRFSKETGLEILSDKEIILYTTSGKDVTAITWPITIAEGVEANLTLSKVQIVRDTQGPAISVNVAEGDTATLNIRGTNSLTAKGAYAAIQKEGEGKLVIQGINGTVTATAGSSEAFAAAGIGGGSGVEEVSNIEIAGNVKVNAFGSTPTNGSYDQYGAAGIGSQYNTPASDIVISGGTVTATGGVNAAGIGSGANASSDNIVISGGTVTATGGSDTEVGNGGAGIGSGAKLSGNVSATNITISGGTVTAKGGEFGGAGIGSGSEVNVENITITGGNIAKTTGGTGAAGIGSGYAGKANNIAISGGVVTEATGGTAGAGIGSGVYGDVSGITISDTASITAATGGEEGAGIGSGGCASATDISINTTKTVNAIGGSDAAGIGSGCNIDEEVEETAQNIKLQNVGTITATGTGSGAGIGAGAGSSAKNIQITGEEGVTTGVLNANGTVTAIGAYNGDVDTIQILTDSKVVAKGTIGTGTSNTAKNITVIGDSIYGAEDTSIPTFGTLTDSLYMIRDSYAFYGKGSILKSCNVEAGSTMLLEENAKVVIPENVTVTIDASNENADTAVLDWATDSNAQLTIDGTLDVKGSMAMNSENGVLVLNGELKLADNALVYGTFYNHGTVSGNGKVMKGDTQKEYEGSTAVYMNMDIDQGVEYTCKGTAVNNQVIIGANDLDNKVTGAYTISGLTAQDGYSITDILMNGESVMDDVTESNGAYAYTFTASTYECAPGENTSVTFSVRAKAKVEKLVIEQSPSKLQYAKGTELDLNGLVVSKVYLNGEKETLDVSDNTVVEISGFDSNIAEDVITETQTVTILYKGEDAYTEDVAATFDVTINNFGGINADASYILNGEDKIYPTSVNDTQRIVTFALEENMGAIEELADKLTIKGKGFGLPATDIIYDSCDGNGVYPTEAQYMVVVYLDEDRQISTEYTVVITQPAYQIDLSDATIMVSGDYTYTGEAIEPEKDNISVVDTQLDGIVDGSVVGSAYYTVSYSENTNAGTATVTVTGDGVNATGSAEGTFTIGKATLTADKLAVDTQYTVTNEAEQTIQLTMDEIVGLDAEDYTVAFEKATDSNEIIKSLSSDGLVTTYASKTGEAGVTMTVTVNEDATNYTAGAVSTDFTITLQEFVEATELTVYQDGTVLTATEDGDTDYSLSMYEGNELELVATMQEGATETVTWSSDNTEVATVENGVITAVNAGDAVITVSTKNLTKTIQLTVAEKEKLAFTGTQSYEKTVGDESFDLDVTVSTEGLYLDQYELTYATSNDKVATVDEAGIVSVIGEGSATITVTATPASDVADKYVAGEYVVSITVAEAPCTHTGTVVTDEAVTATCVAAGKTEGSHCSECEEVIVVQETVPALGHKLSKVAAVAATETTAGNIGYYTCDTCKKHFSDAEGKTEIAKESTVIPATGHKLTKVEAVEATETTAGNIEHYECDTCEKCFSDAEGKTEITKESTVIPATGHKLTKVEAVEATETTAGNIEYYACDTCKKYFSDAEGKTEIVQESTVIPATGKKEEKPVTTVKPAAKGTKITDDKGMTYKVTNANSASPAVEFTAPKKGAKGTVKISDTITISGVTYRVTGITNNAFKNNKKITKVTIGKNVITIGKNAFSGCSKLKNVTIGANVTTISDKAFYKCSALTKITIPSKVKKIGKSAFEGCKKLKSVTIKTTKLTNKNVGSKAFKGIKSNATIKVPKSKLKAYKTLLVKKGVSKKAKIKK